MIDAASSAIFVPLWLLALPVFWLGITALLSLLSGWFSLAKRFKASVPPSGDRFRFVSASMGVWFFPINYSNCLTLTVGVEGIHIAVLFPFRFLSPPLFIPWAMI